MQRSFLTAATLLWLAAAANAQTATGVEDIRRGVLDGTAAGRHSSVLLPLGVAVGSAATLALTDNAELTNNHIVTALVANTAISAGATFIAAKLLKPRPTRQQREALAQQSSLYANSWLRGFRESAGNRRFAASAIGILTGAAVSATIYSFRAK